MGLIKSHKSTFAILEHASAPIRSVPTGTVILTEGSDSKEMFILRKGRVAIAVRGKMVEEIEPGGMFGEMGLIDHENRSATATATEDCELLPIDERLFVVLVQDTPYFALDVMGTLVSRIRAMNAILVG